MSEPAVPINQQTGERFVRVVKSFLSSEMRWRALGLFALLIGLLFAISGLNVVNSYVGRDFMTAISGRDQAGFVRIAIVYVGVFAASTVVAVFQSFAEQRLGLLWRTWLTARLITFYLDGRTYYWVKQTGAVDNPDQRIAEDVKAFTATTLSFILIFLNGTFTIVAFAGVLWTISRLLFAVAVGYAALGSLLTVLLGRPLVGLNYRQLDREANFRTALNRVHEHAESVALLHWEGLVTAQLRRRLNELVDNYRRITSVNRNLGFFTTGYNYLIQIIPALIVAPLYINREVEFGVVTQSAMAFAQLLGAFSLVINQFQSISSFAAVTARLDALGRAVEHTTAPDSSAIETIEDRDRMAYERLTLRAPDGDGALIKDLSVSISPGARLLVTGPNEAARVCLFRATAGLWHGGEGKITRPPLDEVLFLPQRPDLPPVTLRELLLGPGRAIPDDQILAALRAAGLGPIAERAGGLDVERDWASFVPLADQKLLALTRVILAGPRFALLDRVETTLGPGQLRQALQRLTGNSITPIHLTESAESLEPYDAVLEIASDGAWAWRRTESEPVRDRGDGAHGHSVPVLADADSPTE
jgi:vitamin B12/bleomycin/antimicrobial peptide transport system ATP-binding/permease protein